jgi:UDP-N-acetyl-D-mannosaminuronic acid dehydrogenase
MSSSVMQVKAEEIDTAEKREKLTVSIVGCGQTGILQACLFADAGFKVICVDSDQTVVQNITKGKATLKSDLDNKLKSHIKTGHLSATNDIKKAVSQSDLVAITIPIKIDAKRKADYSDMEKTCKQIGSSLRHGSLVVVMGLTGIGITEGLIKETLENTSGLKAGTDFGLAYSPFQTSCSQTLEAATSGRRIVAAADKNSLNATSAIIESVGKSSITKKENTRTAEAAALFEILQQDVKDALANELGIFCEKLGIDYLEAQKLVGVNAGSRLSPPGFDVARAEPYLLLEDAESLNVKLRISAAARETNEEMPKHVINLTKDALRNCGKTLRRARVTLLGVSQIPNAKGPAKRMAREIVDMLETKGARVNLYDPYIPESELKEMQSHFKKNLPESVEGADCIIIVTGHDQFKRLNLNKLKLVMKMPAAIVDLEGIIEPSKTEKEGFIYRGLGRGVWTR